MGGGGKSQGIGYWEAVSIGVGGMVGGGIFAVLGLAVELARGGTPVAFLIAGLIALVTAYSYSRLSVTFPSQGGTVAFLDRAFGPGMVTGSLNILLWLSYIVMLALYAFAFGSYGAAFLPPALRPVWKHLLITVSVIAITGLNMLSASVIGRAERWIVVVKVLILLGFIGLGLWTVNVYQLEPLSWASPGHLFAGGMIIFAAYEGFELIANTAQDVASPERTLPRAFYSAVGFVIVLYILAAVVTVGNLSVGDIVAAKDYALAEAARPFMGEWGFSLVAVAAVLSTASAINATLYGSARLSYTIAKDGELPSSLEKKVWSEPVEGLLITALATLLVANLFDLSAISTMGSAGFLILFALVNAANVRSSAQTHGHAWLSAVGVVGCVVALGALIWQAFLSHPGHLWLLVMMLILALAVEASYRFLSNRSIHLPHRSPFQKQETT